MAYINEGAAANVPIEEAYAPNINNLYAAFEQSEDQLRMALFNKKLGEQAGDEFHVDFFYGQQVEELDDVTLYALAACYRDVFNESWHESWTVDSALKEIRSSLQKKRGRTPVLSLLYKMNRLVGFCMAYVIESRSFNDSNMAFSSSTLKRHESIEIAQYWLNQVSKNSKFATIRELGVLKEFRQDKALFLCLPVLEKSHLCDCKVIFFRTKVTSQAFKLSLGVGFVPLQFFIVDDLLLMQGNLKYAVNLLHGTLGKKKRESWRMFFSNINRYLCQ